MCYNHYADEWFWSEESCPKSPFTKDQLQYENDKLRTKLKIEQEQFQSKTDLLENEIELLQNKLAAANSQIFILMNK
jgi:hypothetical protein